MRYIVFLVVALSFSAASAAPPVVSGVAGTFGDGSSVTISVSGAGVKQTAAPLMYDTVTNVPAYSGLSHGDNPVVGLTDYWQGYEYAKVALEGSGVRVPGRGSYFGTPRGYMRGWNYYDQLGIDVRQFYVSFFHRYEGDSADRAGFPGDDYLAEYIVHRANSAKLGRILSYQDTHVLCDNAYVVPVWAGAWATRCGYTACTTNVYTGDITTLPPDDWTHVEWVMDSRGLTDCLDMQGYALAYHDNQPMNDDSGTSLRLWTNNDGKIFGGSTPLREIWLIGYDPSVTSGSFTLDPYGSVSWSTESDTTWFGEIYVDSTQARVVAGNAPTYEACTEIENQIPTSWNGPGGQIVVDVNTGLWADDENVWVYVFNTDGEYSNGYPVTVNAASGNPSAPGRPQNMSAVER